MRIFIGRRELIFIYGSLSVISRNRWKIIYSIIYSFGRYKQRIIFVNSSINLKNLPNKEYFIFVKFAPPSSPKKISIPVKIVHRIQRRENWINSKKRERERESIGAELVFNFFCRINAKIGEGRLSVGGES